MSLAMTFILYTVLLMWLGRRAKGNAETFRDGGRQISPVAVFLMVTALWSSSLVVVQIDTAYSSGVSAVWYGVSVAVMSILVSLLIPWFRSRNYISNSALLGQTFGPAVKRFSGLVIGATFPIFALSNALAAGAFLHVALQWPLWWSMGLTTLALVLYIEFAGMLSLARTQGVNFVMVMVGLALAVDKLLKEAPLHHAATVAPAFWHLGGIGHGLIWVWFGMNTLNVFAAQAEIQAVASARHVRQAQKAVWLSTALLIVIIAVSTWIGMETRLIFGKPQVDGLVAFAHVMIQHSPTWVVVVEGLGIWALALTWCGPLLFSGAISLGGDVLARQHVVRWTRLALLIEGALMVAYGLWRPGEVAWWRVFGLTLRNAAVVGPTLAVFLWQDLPAPAAFTSMLAGVVVGLGCNALTGFSATHFVLGINPMWSAATTTFLVLGVWRLIQHKRWTLVGVGFILYAAVTVWMVRVMTLRAEGGLLGVVVLMLGLAFLGLAWLGTRDSVAEEPMMEKKRAGMQKG